MASTMRRTNPRLTALARQLAERLPGLQARGAELFQLLRLRARVEASAPGYAPELAINPRQSFQPADVAAPSDDEAAITVNAFGLTGPSGALPFAFNDLVMQRRRLADPALGRFLGVFSRRAIDLLYRAWRKYRSGIALEAQAGNGADSHSRMLAGLSGLSAPDPAALGYAALLARPVRSEGALGSALSQLLDVPVRIESLTPRWLALPSHERSRLGCDPWQQGFNRLGVDCLIGQRTLDCQSAITLRLGPLSHAQFSRFFEDQAYRAALARFLSLAVPPTLMVRAKLILHKEDVPESRLGHNTRLGAGSWLAETLIRRDRDDCLILLQTG
jgi:type VI secretion system protein ImpH